MISILEENHQITRFQYSVDVYQIGLHYIFHRSFLQIRINTQTQEHSTLTFEI